MKVSATKISSQNPPAVITLLIVKEKEDKIDESDEDLYHDTSLNSTINIPETTI